MSIIELLEQVGCSNVRVQSLDESMVESAHRKSGATAITFLTTEINTTEVATGQSKMFGMILWIPREKLPNKSK